MMGIIPEGPTTRSPGDFNSPFSQHWSDSRMYHYLSEPIVRQSAQLANRDASIEDHQAPCHNSDPVWVVVRPKPDLHEHCRRPWAIVFLQYNERLLLPTNFLGVKVSFSTTAARSPLLPPSRAKPFKRDSVYWTGVRDLMHNARRP